MKMLPKLSTCLVLKTTCSYIEDLCNLYRDVLFVVWKYLAVFLWRVFLVKLASGNRAITLGNEVIKNGVTVVAATSGDSSRAGDRILRYQRT